MTETPKIQDKVVSVPKNEIPHIKSKDDSGSRTREKGYTGC